MDALNSHIENEYFVRLTQLPELDGFSVVFPKNILVKPAIEEIAFEYRVVEEGVTISCSKFEDEEELIECENYCKRICIMIDIFVKCMMFGLSQTLIKGFTCEGEEFSEGWLKMLPEFMNSEDTKKELTLLGVFYNILNKREIDIEKCQDVLEGKDLIYTLYEREGIKL